MATLDSIEAQLKSYRFSLLDTFTDTDETALASHTPEINFSAGPWLKQNGQNMVISDEGGGVFVAKPVADDFTPARTLYTMDAGSENYIIRARLSGFRVAPGMLMFRVAANDSYYGILFNHDTVASYLRIFEFNGDETTILADVNPGSLVSESYHWYQIHVAGSRVRAFVEGFNVEAVAEMSINLSETRIGIGGQRASTKFDAIEVIPLQPGASGEAFSTKLDVLTASTELLATSVPSAITGLKGELGAAAVAAMNANPPDVVTDSLSAAAISNLNSSLAGMVVFPLNAIPLQVSRTAATRLVLRRFVNFTHTIDDVGALADATRIVFTIKANLDNEVDAASLLQLSVSLPADGDVDGVLHIGGSPATSSQRPLGSISIVDYAENAVDKKRLVISVRDSITALVPVESAATFDVKYFTATASNIIDEGTISVQNVTTRLTT